MNSNTPLTTLSAVSRQLDVAYTTLIGWERAGKIGPFTRDNNGHRLLTPEDIEKVRQYSQGRVTREAA